jgi:putative dehydrogenase
MTDKTAFIGLGIMGGAIAGNLVAKGHRVVGYDIDPRACAQAAAAGVDIQPDIATAAADAAVVFTSLPSSDAAFAVLAEISKPAKPGCIIVETSTLPMPDKFTLLQKATDADLVLLDCPLSGTGPQAKAGEVVVYASGDRAAIASCERFFKAFSRLSFDLGEFGNGSKMKLVANHLVAIHNVATAEAMVLGMKAGLDPMQIVEVIGAGAGSSKTFEMRAPFMARNHYEPPTMQLVTWKKDMDAIEAFRASVGASTPIFDSTRDIYAMANAMGFGLLDTAVVCRALEQMTNLSPRI